jgi:hypothetical protein
VAQSQHSCVELSRSLEGTTRLQNRTCHFRGIRLLSLAVLGMKTISASARPSRHRRSSMSSRSARVSVGSAGLPPPTTVGQTNSWYSSTSPACAARLSRPARLRGPKLTVPSVKNSASLGPTPPNLAWRGAQPHRKPVIGVVAREPKPRPLRPLLSTEAATRLPQFVHAARSVVANACRRSAS